MEVMLQLSPELQGGGSKAGGEAAAQQGDPEGTGAAKPTNKLRGRGHSAGRGRGVGGRGRGGGRKRGSPKGRSPQKRASQKATESLSNYVNAIEPHRLLEHAEEIQLCRQVQRLKELELLYEELAEEADGAGERQSAAEAIAAVGGTSQDAWAALAQVSVAELQEQLCAGLQAREHIVASNVRLVGHSVRRMKRASGGRVDHGTTEADLVQEGCIALLRAAERFDVSFGVRFGTYATFWVKAAIERALHEQTRIVRLPSRVHTEYNKIKKVREQLRTSSGQMNPSDHEVSAELQANGVKLSPDRVRQVVQHVLVRPSSLDARLGSEDSAASVLDLVRDDGEPHEASIVHSMLRSELTGLMSRHLSPEETRVLVLRLGLEDGKTRTVRAVGEEIGLPYTRAKHVLFSALSKMRKPHVSLTLRDYMADG